MRPPHLTFGPYAFDPGSRVLRRAGEELPLPPRVVGVLEVLLRRAGDVVPRQELIESVWKDAFVTDTSLAEAVSALRQALGDDPQTPTYVQTLHRRGYRFVAPVTEAPFDADRSAARSGPSGGAGRADPPTIAGWIFPWSAAAVLAVVAATAVWHAATARQTADPAVVRFSMPLSPGTRLDARAPALAISPDATVAAWSACDAAACRIYTRTLQRMNPEIVPGTEGAAAPFFSPDGHWIGYFADGRLKKVSLAGGAPISLTDAPDVRGAIWRQGHIIFAGSATGGLARIPESGGEPETFTIPRVPDGEVAHAWPALTPSGTALLFTIVPAPGSTSGYAGAVAAGDPQRPDGWRTLVGGIGMVAAPSADAIVFSRGNELQTTWFDSRTFAITGAAPAVVSPLSWPMAGGHFAVSRTGALLMAEPPGQSRPMFAWITGDSEETVIDLDRRLEAPSLSADGKRLAGTDSADGTRADIWVADLTRGTTSRVTIGANAATPVWRDDALFYAARDDGPYAIWRKDTESPTSAPVRIHAATTHVFPAALTADGSALAFQQRGAATRSDLWLLPLAGGTPSPLVQTPFEEGSAAFSPDGTLLAYESSEAGRWDVYVLRRSDGKRVVVSRAGGTRPHWSADGSALYFQVNREVLRASFDWSSNEVRIGPPVRVAVTGDGELTGIDRLGRLLVRRPPLQPTSVTLALHWAHELRTILGPPPSFLPR